MTTYDAAKLAAARLRAADLQPYLAVALYALQPFAAPGLGTFAVDERWRLSVDPQALAKWSVVEVAGVLLHETGHVVRDHAGRARDAGVDQTSALRWNVAGDAEINDDLLADGVKLPGRPVVPKSLGLPRGKAAEFYYRHLQQPPLELPNCGAGAHGVEDGRRGDAVSVAPIGIERADADLVRRRVALAVIEWARGQAPGRNHGGWERWAEAVLEPAIDWRRVLAAEVRRGLGLAAGRVDYAFDRPSRRPTPGVLVPSLRRPQPLVAAVIDTSGSMTDEDLGRAWSEVRGCLRSVGTRRDLLKVYATDVIATRITDVGARRVAVTGGGGTDLRQGLSAALADRPRPDLVVVLTDGDTPWPDRAPSVPVVVVLVRQPLGTPPPTWARVVHVPAAG